MTKHTSALLNLKTFSDCHDEDTWGCTKIKQQGGCLKENSLFRIAAEKCRKTCEICNANTITGKIECVPNLLYTELIIVSDDHGTENCDGQYSKELIAGWAPARRGGRGYKVALYNTKVLLQLRPPISTSKNPTVYQLLPALEGKFYSIQWVFYP